MKFCPLACDSVEQTQLTSEYGAARQIGKTRLGELRFYFRARGCVYYIPYRAVGRVFRRVELVPAGLCCGRGRLEVENLVLCGRDGAELAQLRLPGARAGTALLEAFKTLAPEAAIGKKPAEEGV